MDGVEILNATQIYGQTWIGLIGLLTLAFGFFFMIIALIEGRFKTALILFIVGAIGGCCVYYDATILTAIEYQAVVEDSVSYKELVDKYEIVEVKGKLFTLKENIGDEVPLLSDNKR